MGDFEYRSFPSTTFVAREENQKKGLNFFTTRLLSELDLRVFL